MRAGLVTAILVGVAAASAARAELMPVAQQNALIGKYCAVCHTDAAKNGGLSLEHFDAAQAPPSLTAMLLSKLTGGVLLKTAGDASSDAGAAALVDQGMKSGAMGAAGIPIPDNATIGALIHAMAVESAGAMDWSVRGSKDTGLTASVLREMPSAKLAGHAEVYRLIASCNPATQQGELQVAWSPAPTSGSLAASVDGGAAVQYRVEGAENMGNGSKLVLHSRAALVLSVLPFPAESLTIRDLFPDQTVTFSFTSLPETARRVFNACFGS
jgi:hypothetical protein